MSDRADKRFNIGMGIFSVAFILFVIAGKSYDASKKCVEWEEIAEYNGLVGWVTGSTKLGALAAREKTVCRKWEKEWFWE
jgi:hypothetical protein